ncbi:hypothetical protein D3C72_1748490 [compost metagenome]
MSATLTRLRSVARVRLSDAVTAGEAAAGALKRGVDERVLRGAASRRVTNRFTGPPKHGDYTGYRVIRNMDLILA